MKIRILLLSVVLASAGCGGSILTSVYQPTVAAPFTITWSDPAFPTTRVSTTSSTKLVVGLWNTGTTSVPIASVTGTNTADFPFTSTCGSTLAPSSNCAITVSFAPATAGDRTGNLTIAANSTTETIPLTGTATAFISPQLTITPTNGTASTTFVLALSAATPGGQVELHTTFTPQTTDVPGMTIATVVSKADASGSLTTSVQNSSVGTYEVWFVDVASGLSTPHGFYFIQP